MFENYVSYLVTAPYPNFFFYGKYMQRHPKRNNQIPSAR